MEIESKYAADGPEPLNRLRETEELGRYRLGLVTEQTITDRYHDTPDRALWEGGYALRYRDQNGTSFVTLKGRGGSKGSLHRREEYEFEAAPGSLPGDWPDETARNIVSDLAGDRPLKELLTLKQTRLLRPLYRGMRKAASLSLDSVVAQAGERRQPSWEVEAELEETGTREDLRVLEKELTALGLKPEPRSKFERALALLESPSAEESPMEPQTTAPEDSPEPSHPAEEGAFSRESPPQTVEGLLDKYQVDRDHAGHVARMTLLLFDRLPDVHGLAPSLRGLLETAALLHNIGMDADPERHHTVGRDQVMGEALEGVNETERQMLACIVRFHRKKVKPEAEPLFVSLPEDRRQDTLAMAALLRVGDALDYSGTQTSRMETLVVSDEEVRLGITGEHAQGEAERANKKADLWNKVFSHTLIARSANEPGSLCGNPRDGSNEEASTASNPPQSDGETMTAQERAVKESSSEPTESWRYAEDISQQPANGANAAESAGKLDEGKEESPSEASGGGKNGKKKLPGVEPTDSMAASARKVLRFHFDRLVANEEGTLEGEDIEALHDMRVASRRLRAAIALFGDYLPRKAVKRLNRGLRLTGRALGPVRDLDVLMEKTRKELEKHRELNPESLDGLISSWKDRRDEARTRMLNTLCNDRYRRFKDDFEAFLQDTEKDDRKAKGDHVDRNHLLQPDEVRHVAPGLIWSHYGEVRAYEEILDNAPIDTLHALRIECKRLRYTLEFLKEPLGQPGQTLIQTVTQAQDHLGDLHDADVACHILRVYIHDCLQTHHSSLTTAERIQGALQYLSLKEAELGKLIDSFPDIWETLTDASFRLQLGEAVAAL